MCDTDSNSRIPPEARLRCRYVVSVLSSLLLMASALTAAGQTTTGAATNARTADSAPSKEQCLDNHLQAQEAQSQGKLMRARELASTCTHQACPGLVIDDCARWLADLEQRIPSVVFEVRVHGKPNRDVSVFVDGKRMQKGTRWEAVHVDPGEHEFRFELESYQPVTQIVPLAEGMRFRVVSAELNTRVQPSSSIDQTHVGSANTKLSNPARPTPAVVYPLLGLGALGAIVGVAGELLGANKEGHLETSCNPNCSDADLRPMRNYYLLGDLGLAVSTLSLAAAGVVYFTRPEAVGTPMIGLVPLRGGGAALATCSF